MAKLIVDQLLKKKGISKRQFAKLLGIRYENVFRLFRPTSDPRFSTLVKWAKLLGVKVRDLIKE